MADFKVTAPHNNRQLQAEGHLCMSFKQGLVSKPVTNYISNIIKANSKNFIQCYDYFQAQFSRKAANHPHPLRHTHTHVHTPTPTGTHTPNPNLPEKKESFHLTSTMRMNGGRKEGNLWKY